MEKLTWFKFVISDWMMGKIMKCPETTQARFIRLCCLYWNKECILSIEDAEIEIDEEHLLILFSKKIVIKDDEFISIKFLDEQNSNVASLSETRRLAVQERWKKAKEKKALELQSNTNVLKNDSNVIQSDTEKRRVEKSREEKKKNKDITEPTVSVEKSKEVYNEVKVFFNDLYLECYKTEYIFSAKDAAKVKSIIKKVHFKMKEKDGREDFTESELTNATKFFIQATNTVADKWLKSNMSLSNIDSKFNEIYSSIKNPNNGITKTKQRSIFAD